MTSDTATLNISVIIPVWNGAARIGKTLAALADQTADPERFEIIVVDNGSTDGTTQIVRGFAGVRLLSEPRPGSYRARNLGLAAAANDWLLFTDADCVPARDWIKRACEAALVFPDAGAIGGRIDLFREDGCGEIAFAYEQMMAFNQRQNLSEGRCVTANWLSPKATMVRLGGFDADLLSGGDVEMSHRLASAGQPLVYAHDMVVNHPSRATLRELVSKRRRTMGGRFALQKIGRRDVPAWIRQLARETRNNLRRVRRLPLPARTRIGLASYFLILLAAAEAELLALAAGKPPYRS